MNGRISLVLSILLLCGSVRLHADPPDPPLIPNPNEDVLRPRLPGSDAWFGQLGLGFNYTIMSGNPALRSLFIMEGPTTVFESASGFAPLFYGVIGYRYSPSFSMRVRLDVDQRHVANNGTAVDTCELVDQVTGAVSLVPIEVTNDYEVGVTYLTWSLLAAYHVDPLYLFGGVSVGTPLSRTVRETKTINDATNPCFYFPFTADQSKVVQGALPTSDNIATRVSLKLGVGYTIPLSPGLDLVPEVGADLGLTDAFQQPSSGAEVLVLTNPDVLIPTQGAGVTINHAIRLNSIQATIGVRFGL